MKLSVRIVPAALLVAAVAAPAPALAGPSSNSASAHAERSRAAAAKLVREVRQGDRRGALAALRTSRREAAAASRVARRHAARKPGSAGAANAATLVARTYDANLETYVGLIAKADDGVATALANALAPTLNGREQAIRILEAILPVLPEAARGPIAEVIARLSADNPQDAVQLGAVLQSPSVPVDVKGIVAGVFAAVTAIVESSLEQVSALLPLLPDAARGPVESALGIASSVLEQVDTLLAAVLGGGLVPAARGAR